MVMRLLGWKLAGKRVFLRADLNTDLEPRLFTQSLKFQRLLPTLTYLKAHGAHVTLVTHLGRPHGYDPKLSTQQLVPYFMQAGFSCIFSTPDTLSHYLTKSYDSILLENIRFYEQEEHASSSFAQKITEQCSFFIEDGFGVLARPETSVVTAAQLFKQEDRSIGLLIQRELDQLRPLKTHAKRPYLVMVGGGKPLEKLEMLYSFFGLATHIALCPGLSELPEAASFIRDARAAGIVLLIPTDYLFYNGKKISIGPQTYAAWQPIITSMQTIVYNGMMGILQAPETTLYTKKIFELFMHADAQVIIAGGDTSLAAQLWDITSNNIYLSTGGGSTLAYLSGNKLPGLDIIGA